MAYAKQTWLAGSGGGTPLSATRHQHMEDGIEDAADVADAAYALASGGAGLAAQQFVAVDYTGVADAASAINSAIAALPAGGGEVIVVPSGGDEGTRTVNLASTLNIGNGGATTVAAGSNGLTLPQATIQVAAIADVTPTSGTIYLVHTGTTHTITYTGWTNSPSPRFTGCSGGTGTISTNDVVGWNSTRNGVILRTLGGGAARNIMQLTGNDGPVRFLWGGAADGKMIGINGPCAGVGLRDLTFDGNSTAGDGVVLQSAVGGIFENISVRNCKGANIVESAVRNYRGQNNNTMHNTWLNTCVTMIDDTSFGILCTGTTESNACYEEFINTQVLMPATTSSGVINYGVFLQACDNIRFQGLHFMNMNASTGTKRAITFDYTVNAGWPADCFLEGVDFGTSTNSGTVFCVGNGGSPSGATANRIVNISATNGRPTTPSLTNMQWGYSNASP